VYQDAQAHARPHLAGFRVFGVDARRGRHEDPDLVQVLHAVYLLRLRGGAAVEATARLGPEQDVRPPAFLDLAQREFQAEPGHLLAEFGDRLVDHLHPKPTEGRTDRVGQRVLRLDVLVPRNNGHGLAAPWDVTDFAQ